MNSDLTGNLLSTTIDALIRGKYHNEKQHWSETITKSCETRLLTTIESKKKYVADNPTMAQSILKRKKISLVPLISKSFVVASSWTIGIGIIIALGVRWSVQRFQTSWQSISLEDWELMCRDQLPDFWNTEILPALESEHICGGRLAQKLIRKTRPLMKKRIKLAEHVSTILGRHLKDRQPLNGPEKELLALYYSEITVEKLYSVTERLRAKVEKANQNRTIKRHLGDRSMLVEAMTQRVNAYLTENAILLDENALRRFFKESLREAIKVDGNDDEEQCMDHHDLSASDGDSDSNLEPVLIQKGNVTTEKS